MNQIRELKNNIAASLFLVPCDIEELLSRDFLKTKSRWGVDRLIMMLEKENALYYKGEVMHIKKEWAKKHLKEYELDFRSERQKEQAGWTKFKKQVVNRYGL